MNFPVAINLLKIRWRLWKMWRFFYIYFIDKIDVISDVWIIQRTSNVPFLQKGDCCIKSLGQRDEELKNTLFNYSVVFWFNFNSSKVKLHTDLVRDFFMCVSACVCVFLETIQEQHQILSKKKNKNLFAVQ